MYVCMYVCMYVLIKHRTSAEKLFGSGGCGGGGLYGREPGSKADGKSTGYGKREGGKQDSRSAKKNSTNLATLIFSEKKGTKRCNE